MATKAFLELLSEAQHTALVFSGSTSTKSVYTDTNDNRPSTTTRRYVKEEAYVDRSLFDAMIELKKKEASKKSKYSIFLYFEGHAGT